MIDNAWASPAFARPFDWGIDVSLLPLTKYWGGHADFLMGAAVVRTEHWPKLWQAIRQLGVCVGGDDAFLALRGLRTAEVRMRRHEATALEVARWLDGRPEVARVLHPALPSHPQHEPDHAREDRHAAHREAVGRRAAGEAALRARGRGRPDRGPGRGPGRDGARRLSAGRFRGNARWPSR
jgi:cystathionine beta-lyase/cystathionine gamma-synthase